MRICFRLLACIIAGSSLFPAAHSAPPQTPASGTEIPLQRCDRLPIVILRADNVDKRFLVDTAATSLLNENSFPRGHNRAVRIQSWNETAALNAREVSIGELSLGDHILQGVKLPAIDLSAVAKACGGAVDGILGVDLLEQLGVTIDLKRSVASLGITRQTPLRPFSSRTWTKQCIPAPRLSITRMPTNWLPVSIRISC